jgi:hypothetical protein
MEPKRCQCQHGCCEAAPICLLLTYRGADLSWQVEPDAEAGETPQRRYENRGEAGAPAPLAPSLVTLSLLPRTQARAVWQYSSCPGFRACSSCLILEVLHGTKVVSVLPEPSCLVGLCARTPVLGGRAVAQPGAPGRAQGAQQAGAAPQEARGRALLPAHRRRCTAQFSSPRLQADWSRHM